MDIKVIRLKDYEDPREDIIILVHEKDFNKAVKLIKKAVKYYENEYPLCCYEVIIDYLTEARINYKILGDADCVINY
jgi:hypothetical protein